ncbi:MAG: cell division protein FtsZ, partial [Firmicutes bacterium]|nr:cell division protein FtsZ [Bacillota bacterium]
MENYDLDNFEPAARIVVIGVGGAGNNAVNRMIDDNIANIEFWVANTDKQALATSKARNRLILGNNYTQGLGAGGDPSVGKEAAKQSTEDIRKIVKGANMVFIAAGMGGGTGTGAAPIIAAIAREEGALTVAIVTRPFTFEGKRRIANAVEGLNELKESVDSIIIVSNDKLLMMSGNAPIGEAFRESDKVLSQSVKTVTDLILLPAVINLDFADVRNTLKGSGIALIGFGLGQGPHKAEDAAQDAVSSPLLEASLNGARKAIVAVTCGPQVSLYEAQETVSRIIEIAGTNPDIKFGVSINDQLSDQIL